MRVFVAFISAVIFACNCSFAQDTLFVHDGGTILFKRAITHIDSITFNYMYRVPILSSYEVSTVLTSSATSGGTIISDGGTSISARGVCWNTIGNPTTSDSKTNDGTGLGGFTSFLRALTPNTTYFMRAYATNNSGTGYGPQVSFTTLMATDGIVTDYDGNVYNTVRIGTQVWMVDNLKTTHYRNGENIPNVANDSVWNNLRTGAYCNYNNDTNIATTNGRLYNWYALTDTRNLAPSGWHVPTTIEFALLRDYLIDNGFSYNEFNANISKSMASKNGWVENPWPGSPGNIPDLNNRSGFNGIPSGYRSNSQSFMEKSNVGYWGTTTSKDEVNSNFYALSGTSPALLMGNFNKLNGVSVRCIKGEANIPTLTTTSPFIITSTSTFSGGNITHDGGAEVTKRGVCWNTTGSPMITDSITIDGYGAGNFTSCLTGLNANTSYFVRSYATNTAGTAYGSEFSFTTKPMVDGIVTDVDGNEYHTVTIGTQVWMLENLKTTRFRNGIEISKNNFGQTTAAYCNYNNDTLNVANYGRLYNWYALTDSGNIAPKGWHIPSQAEWITLSDYLISTGFGYEGSGEDVAKSLAGTSGWVYSSVAGTPGNNQSSNNSSGFTGVPGGLKANEFYYLGSNAFWWSSTEYNYSDAWFYGLNTLKSKETIAYDSKKLGFSVRCLKGDYPTIVVPTLNNTLTPFTISESSAISGGNVSRDRGAMVTSRGVCWNTTGSPTISDCKTSDSTGVGGYLSSLTGLTANTLYYVRAYATNLAGTGYGPEISFITKKATDILFKDIDGNVYDTITIGTQTWMLNNLATTRFRNGDSIPLTMDQTNWKNASTGTYCSYNNSERSAATYGRLYNWNAVVDPRQLAPVGWHIPSDTEWIILLNYLRNNGFGYNGFKDYIVKSMAANYVWNPNLFAETPGYDQAKNNSSGFTALPGGFRSQDGYFSNIGKSGSWWSSTTYNTTNAKYMGFSNDNWALTSTYYASMKIGFSVRCIKDTLVPPTIPTLITTSISDVTTRSATCGGDITDDGGSAVTERGVCWNNTGSPTILNSKTTDKSGTGLFTSYLTNLMENTTYYVRAYSTNSVGTAYGDEVSFTTQKGLTVSDIDGNNYKIVTIGTQVWMAENLKTTRYQNGDSIPCITDYTSWGALRNGAYCNYNNDTTNASKYGHLYNWYTVTDHRNIAPVGWHVPTDAEWTTLSLYLTNSGFGFEGSGDDVAKSMAATSGWKTSSTAGALGNEQISNNSSGFATLPGGYRNAVGTFTGLIDYSFWWSTSAFSAGYVWNRYLYYANKGVYRGSSNENYGFSVRCVKNQ